MRSRRIPTRSTTPEPPQGILSTAPAPSVPQIPQQLLKLPHIQIVILPLAEVGGCSIRGSRSPNPLLRHHQTASSRAAPHTRPAGRETARASSPPLPVCAHSGFPSSPTCSTCCSATGSAAAVHTVGSLHQSALSVD